MFCSTEISSIEYLIVLQSNEIWIKSMSIEHGAYLWYLCNVFVATAVFTFERSRQERYRINTKHWKNEKKATATCQVCMKSVADETETCASNSSQNNIFAVYFQTICRILMLNACVHQLRPSKCHFHITTVMLDSNETQREKKISKMRLIQHPAATSAIYNIQGKTVFRNQLWHKRCIKINTMEEISSGNNGIYLRLQCTLSLFDGVEMKIRGKTTMSHHTSDQKWLSCQFINRLELKVMWIKIDLKTGACTVNCNLREMFLSFL